MRARHFVAVFVILWLSAWGLETALWYGLDHVAHGLRHRHDRPETLAGAAEAVAPYALGTAAVCFCGVVRLR